jgi:hypothetical protein
MADSGVLKTTDPNCLNSWTTIPAGASGFNAPQIYEVASQVHLSHTDLYFGTQDNLCGRRLTAAQPGPTPLARKGRLSARAQHSRRHGSGRLRCFQQRLLQQPHGAEQLGAQHHDERIDPLDLDSRSRSGTSRRRAASRLGWTKRTTRLAAWSRSRERRTRAFWITWLFSTGRRTLQRPSGGSPTLETTRSAHDFVAGKRKSNGSRGERASTSVRV